MDVLTMSNKGTYRKVKEGRLLVGVTRSKLSSSWGIFKGDVECEDGSIDTIYMKLTMSPNEALREIFCSILANHLGLPTPAPYLVRLPKGYDDFNNVLPYNIIADKYIYGIEIIEHPDLFRNYSQDFFNNTTLGQDFLKNQKLPLMGLFDELVKNTDRHHENLLYNGRTVHLIDHENTLRPLKDKNMLGSKNWFLDISQIASSRRQKGIRRKINQLLSEIDDKQIRELKDTYWQDLLDIEMKLKNNNSESKNLAKSYITRIKCLDRILLESLDDNINQIGLPL